MNLVVSALGSIAIAIETSCACSSAPAERIRFSSSCATITAIIPGIEPWRQVATCLMMHMFSGASAPRCSELPSDKATQSRPLPFRYCASAFRCHFETRRSPGSAFDKTKSDLHNVARRSVANRDAKVGARQTDRQGVRSMSTQKDAVRRRYAMRHVLSRLARLYLPDKGAAAR